MKSPADEVCKRIRELVAWYPTGTLTTEDRARVRNHARTCESCAEALAFAIGLQADLVRGDHPAEESLVRFVDDRGSLSDGERIGIEKHLACCEQCRQEESILALVNGEETRQPHLRPVRAPASGRFQRLWDRAAGSLLRPVLAAAYLTAAIVAIIALVARHDNVSDRPSAPIVGSSAGEVVLLSDAVGERRGLEGPEAEIPILAEGETRCLLLEFTNLESPPRPEDNYAIRVLSAESNEELWRGDVTGEEFLSNYTLYLFLEPHLMSRGEYRVTVTNPQGEVIFRSRFFVE